VRETLSVVLTASCAKCVITHPVVLYGIVLVGVLAVLSAVIPLVRGRRARRRTQTGQAHGKNATTEQRRLPVGQIGATAAGKVASVVTRLLRLVIAAAVGVSAALLVRAAGLHGFPGFLLAFLVVVIVLRTLNVVWPRQRPTDILDPRE
jgi:hypothetical protein